MGVQEFEVDNSGHTIAVEIDTSPFIAYRARMFVDGAPADQQMVVGGTFRLHGAATTGAEHDTRFVVEIKLGYWGTVKRAELRTTDNGTIPLRPAGRGR